MLFLSSCDQYSKQQNYCSIPNLISIYIREDRLGLIEKVIDTFPYIDEDMHGFYDRTIEKLRAMTDEKFAKLNVFAADVEIHPQA